MLLADLYAVVLLLPLFRLVAIDSRDRREGRPIEYLGWYGELTLRMLADSAMCSSRRGVYAC
jgi:hypothetical protein